MIWLFGITVHNFYTRENPFATVSFFRDFSLDKLMKNSILFDLNFKSFWYHAKFSWRKAYNQTFSWHILSLEVNLQEKILFEELKIFTNTHNGKIFEIIFNIAIMMCM